MTVVSVTKRDITKGEAGDPQSCPIALAIRRLVKKSVTADVQGDEGVEFIYKGKFCVRKLPVKAKDFIFDFDDLEAVEPFSFNMNIPKELLR
jgi:hypothetical protein